MDGQDHELLALWTQEDDEGDEGGGEAATLVAVPPSSLAERERQDSANSLDRAARIAASAQSLELRLQDRRCIATALLSCYTFASLAC